MKLMELQSRFQARGGAHPTVLATRLRLSRNLTEPFLTAMDAEQRRGLRRRLFAVLRESELLAAGDGLELEALGPHERSQAAELLLTPESDFEPLHGRGLCFGADPRLSICLGMEDHLRIGCLRLGLDLEGAYACADGLDAELEERLDYAFSEDFGYLGPSPRLAGTGLRASVILMLPALYLSEELQRIFNGLKELHVAARDPWGESEPGSGGWLEVGNARSLGDPEGVYLEQLGRIVAKLDEFERKARERLLSEARALLEDRVWSAYGQLRHARLMPSARARDLLASLRLGCLCDLLPGCTIQDVQDIWLRTRDGQLQAEGPLPPEERDRHRATLLREWLARGEAEMKVE